MVSLSERDGITVRAKTDAEMRGLYAFIFGEAYDFTNASKYSHAELLRTIAERDKKGFSEQVHEFQQRRASQGSGWYDDDSLVFLLLLGCERFQIDCGFLDTILTARDRSPNPIPKRVNEVFRALQRKEYGMEGQLSFIKVPFLHLAGQLNLSINSAEKAFDGLTRPGVLDELSPFLQLLAIRAFDLVLFQRQPQPHENFDELVYGIQKVREHATLGQAVKLLWAIPYKWCLFGMLVVIPFAFGVGRQVYVTGREVRTSLVRPAKIGVSASSDAIHHPAISVRALAKLAFSAQTLSPDGLRAVIAIETTRLTAATPKFSIEASISSSRVHEAYAVLIQPSDGGTSETILPIQKGSGSVRAFLPPAHADSYVIFIVLLQLEAPTDAARLASHTALRTLD